MPVLKGDELNGLIVHIGCEAFLGHCVELFAFCTQITRSFTVLCIFDEHLLSIFSFCLMLVIDKRNEIVGIA